MAQVLVFSYTDIRDWVPIALSVGGVLVGSLQYSAIRDCVPIAVSVGGVLVGSLQYTDIRDWVPIALSVAGFLIGSLQYLVFRQIRARNLRVGQNFIQAESFRANEDQWLASSSWGSLPEDLLSDQILSRLPVKSLIRFKSVCKRWYSLPTNPSFIASHLKHSNTCNTLASWNANIGPNFVRIFTLRCRSLAFQPVNLNFGFYRKPDLVLGPCDGLFCLYWKPRRDYPPLPTIALWNPATRAFSVLPMSKLDQPPYKAVDACLVGFGFDLTTKSIKVVKFVSFMRASRYECNINCAEVYDLSCGSWRVLHVDDTAQAVFDLDDPTHCMYNNNDGVFHWHSYRGCFEITEALELIVLSFDMSREVFHVTLMPDKHNPLKFNLLTTHPPVLLMDCHFSLLRDSLAVIFSLFVAGHGTVEIWVMKKDLYRGVEGGESFSYSLSHDLTVELPYSCPCLAMGFWNKNELLLWKLDIRTEMPPFLYDIVTKQARDLGELNFFKYKESLVSVNGGCGNNNGSVSFL